MRNSRANMGHCLIRATLMPEIIRLITLNFNVSEDKAMEMFYKSATASSFYDSETGLYGQSALFIFSEFAQELRYNENP